MPGALMCQCPDELAAEGTLLERAHEHRSPRRRARQHEVVAQREVEEQRLALAILGHEGNACARGGEDAAAGQARLADEHLAAIGRMQSEDRLEQLRSTGADESEDAEDLAAVDVQAHVVDGGRAGQAADAQHRFGVRGARMLRSRRQIAADHRADDGLGRRGSRLGGSRLGSRFAVRGSRFAVRGSGARVVIERPGVLAVAQHGHPIAEAKDLRKPMRHVEDRHAAVAQVVQDAEQVVGLGGRQRRGRLVEHEDAAIEGERPGDLHELAVRGGQPLHRRLRRERQMQAREQIARAQRASRARAEPLPAPSARGRRRCCR